MKKSFTFSTKMITEQYKVKFRIQKDDGYWTSITEDVFLTVEADDKSNHMLAETFIKNKYPNCIIVTVTYC